MALVDGNSPAAARFPASGVKQRKLLAGRESGPNRHTCSDNLHYKKITPSIPLPIIQIYLFLLGVELEAFIQGTAVLLLMELLLQPNTFSIFNHFFLDVAK